MKTKTFSQYDAMIEGKLEYNLKRRHSTAWREHSSPSNHWYKYTPSRMASNGATAAFADLLDIPYSNINYTP
ncbi:hypothetical protein KIN20_010333 [Parelaphostrongylus tenuis]|uniref:Uncharacterized protein n=1 Tax=Parelaphostrongylus tenuis TaxID=148309 RepID=A0AAD5MT91_PARTN|nr:hypothetical protein KIN20_010333 [Parelaphostrongylus tenuis]